MCSMTGFTERKKERKGATFTGKFLGVMRATARQVVIGRIRDGARLETPIPRTVAAIFRFSPLSDFPPGWHPWGLQSRFYMRPGAQAILQKENSLGKKERGLSGGNFAHDNVGQVS